jgi:CDP-diacylglycerol--glycerol-3-phosphate 3-phosphatidyltransferase
MNLPNLLTVCRILLTFGFIFLLEQRGLTPKVLALVIFTLASVTDFLDGYYARKHHLISAFGKIMDPIADKFLMLSAFFIFMQMHIIAAWIFIVIFAREVIVTGLRLWAVGQGKTLAAEGAGKIKTVLQIVAVYLIMIFIVLAQSTQRGELTKAYFWVFSSLYREFMLGVVLITLWSGLSFIKNNRKEIFHVR